MDDGSFRVPPEPRVRKGRMWRTTEPFLHVLNGQRVVVIVRSTDDNPLITTPMRNFLDNTDRVWHMGYNFVRDESSGGILNVIPINQLLMTRGMHPHYLYFYNLDGVSLPMNIWMSIASLIRPDTIIESFTEWRELSMYDQLIQIEREIQSRGYSS